MSGRQIHECAILLCHEKIARLLIGAWRPYAESNRHPSDISVWCCSRPFRSVLPIRQVGELPSDCPRLVVNDASETSKRAKASVDAYEPVS
jgi:hypothetical protein